MTETIKCPSCDRSFQHSLIPFYSFSQPIDCLLCSSGFFIRRCKECKEPYSSKRGDSVTCSARCRSRRSRRRKPLFASS